MRIPDTSLNQDFWEIVSSPYATPDIREVGASAPTSAQQPQQHPHERAYLRTSNRGNISATRRSTDARLNGASATDARALWSGAGSSSAVRSADREIVADQARVKPRAIGSAA